jgi:hypothetical protein
MINVDVAIFEESNHMGLGLAIRNYNGDFIAAISQGIENITNKEMVKMLAFRRVVHTSPLNSPTIR